MKKLVIILGTLVLVAVSGLNSPLTVNAYTGVESWFQQEISSAEQLGLIPESLEKADFSANITREEFCSAAVNAISLFRAVGEVSSSFHFNDTNDPNILMAYEMGIANGYPNGSFMPDQLISRQEMFKMIDNVLVASNKTAIRSNMDSIKALELLSQFNDCQNIQPWALEPAAILVQSDITKGSQCKEGILLEPTGYTTRAQAIVMLYRALDTDSQGIIEGGARYVQHKANNSLIMSDGIADDTVLSASSVLTWTNQELEESSGVFGSDIVQDQVLESEEFNDKENEISSQTAEPTVPPSTEPPLKEASSLPVPSGPNVGKEKDSSDVSNTSTTLLRQLGSNSAKHALIFGSADATRYESPEIAEANMVNIEIPVWMINSKGQKFSSKKYIDVHKNIADVVKQIFTEIYNGKEKFPIRSVGGYSWRTDNTNSSHKWGVAIDINGRENYYYSTSTGEVLSGSYWQPGIDPYSIPVDGDVVKAFAKYGFIWGGTAWVSSKDYMHFSYFGN